MANPSPLRESISFNSNASISPTVSRSSSKNDLTKSPNPSKNSILQESSKGWGQTRSKKDPIGLSRSHSSENDLAEPKENARKTSSSFKTLKRNIVSNSPFVNQDAPGLPVVRKSRVPGSVPASPVGLGLEGFGRSSTNRTPSPMPDGLTKSMSQSMSAMHSSESTAVLNSPSGSTQKARTTYSTSKLGARTLASGSPFMQQSDSPPPPVPSRHVDPDPSATEELASFTTNESANHSFDAPPARVLPLDIKRPLTPKSNDIKLSPRASPTQADNTLVGKLISPRRLVGPREFGYSSSTSSFETMSPSNSFALGHSRSKSGSDESGRSADSQDALGVGRPRSKTVTFNEVEEVREFTVEEHRRVSAESTSSYTSSESAHSTASDADSDATVHVQRQMEIDPVESWRAADPIPDIDQLMSPTSILNSYQPLACPPRQLPSVPGLVSMDNSPALSGSAFDSPIDPTNAFTNRYQPALAFDRMSLNLPNIAASSPLIGSDLDMSSFMAHSPSPAASPFMPEQPVTIQQPSVAGGSDVFTRQKVREHARQKNQDASRSSSLENIAEQLSHSRTSSGQMPAPQRIEDDMESLQSPLEKLRASMADSAAPMQIDEQYSDSPIVPREEDDQLGALDPRKRGRALGQMDSERPARRRRSLSTSELPAKPLLLRAAIAEDQTLHRPASIDGLPRLHNFAAAQRSSALSKAASDMGTATKSYRAVERHIVIKGSDLHSTSAASSGQRSGPASPGRKIRGVSDMGSKNQHKDELMKYREKGEAEQPTGVVYLKPVRVEFDRKILPRIASFARLVLHNGQETAKSDRFWQMDGAVALSEEWALDKSTELTVQLDIEVRVDPNKDPHLMDSPSLPEPAQPELSRKPSGGFKSKFFGSPKKARAPSRPVSQIVQYHEPLRHRLGKENALASTRLQPFAKFQEQALAKRHTVALPLYGVVGQSSEVLGQLHVEMLYIPPLANVPVTKMPNSLADALRGLKNLELSTQVRHQGRLSQMGGDCPTWKERNFRLTGSQLIASNAIIQRDAFWIDLADIESLENCKDGITKAQTKASFDDFEDRFDVERSFRLHFKNGSFLAFYTTTDAEKQGWIDAFQSLIGSKSCVPGLWATTLSVWLRKREEEQTGTSALSTRSGSGSSLTEQKPSVAVSKERPVSRVAPPSQEEDASTFRRRP